MDFTKTTNDAVIDLNTCFILHLADLLAYYTTA